MEKYHESMFRVQCICNFLREFFSSLGEPLVLSGIGELLFKAFKYSSEKTISKDDFCTYARFFLFFCNDFSAISVLTRGSKREQSDCM